MVSRFSRSLRSVEKDGFGRSNAAALASVVLLGAWGAWFFGARVAVVEVSTRARVETDRAVRPIEASRGGRIEALELELGQTVAAGDVLARLNAEREALALEEEERRQAKLRAELEAVLERERAQTAALAAARETARAAEAEDAALVERAGLVAELATYEWEVAQELNAEGLLSDVKLAEARTEARKTASERDTLPATLERQEAERRQEQSDREALLASVRSERRRLEGELAMAAARRASLAHELAECTVRAPAAGTVGELGALREGDVLRPGDRLGAVVSGGACMVVGEFAPSAAAGRIRAGQPARLRLDGFPWSRYGTVPLAVERVASEPRGGRLQVELGVVGPIPPGIRLEHGLPGTVEVEVDRVRPAELVLQRVARRSPRADDAASRTGGGTSVDGSSSGGGEQRD